MLKKHTQPSIAEYLDRQSRVSCRHQHYPICKDEICDCSRNVGKVKSPPTIARRLAARSLQLWTIGASKSCRPLAHRATVSAMRLPPSRATAVHLDSCQIPMAVRSKLTTAVSRKQVRIAARCVSNAMQQSVLLPRRARSTGKACAKTHSPRSRPRSRSCPRSQ